MLRHPKPMKTLLLMRHAKSSWDNEDLPDHDRPLNDRGKRDAPRMGKHLLDLNLVPDAIVSSTAKRARRTAKKAAEACGFSKEIVEESELYEASIPEWIRVLSKTQDSNERVLGIGHNPGIEEFLESLIGDYEPMPTASLAQVALPIESWADLNGETRGELIGFWTPKELE